MLKEKINALDIEIYALGKEWNSPVGAKIVKGHILFINTPSSNLQGEKFFYNLGERTAGVSAFEEGLELVRVRQKEGTGVYREDLVEFAKGIIDFHYHKIGVRIED